MYNCISFWYSLLTKTALNIRIAIVNVLERVDYIWWRKYSSSARLCLKHVHEDESSNLLARLLEQVAPGESALSEEVANWLRNLAVLTAVLSILGVIDMHTLAI